MGNSWPLLTNERLNGMYRVRRYLRPPSIAQAVPHDDFEQAATLIKKLCGTWGGAYMPLVPVLRQPAVDSLWADLLDASPVNALNENNLSLDIPSQFGYAFRGNGRGVDLLDALAVLPEISDHIPVMVAEDIPEDHPWYLSYLATIGKHMPKPPPRPDGSRRSIIRDDALEFSDIVPIESVGASAGGFDLLKRLRTPNRLTAAELTISRLASTVAGVDKSIFPDDSGISFAAKPLAARYGPNIVVVYDGNNVEDLAAIWYLRSLHGLPAGFPMAVPIADDIASTIGALASKGARRYWGLSSGDAALCSFSVSKERLQEIASELRDFDVVDFGEVVVASHGCLINSIDEIHYNDGQAEVISFAQAEIDILGHRAIRELGGWMSLTTVVMDQSLPPSRTMRRKGYHFGEYLHGYIASVHSRSETVGAFQPTGLEALTALAADHGQKVEPSDAGLAAAQLIELANPHNLSLLASPAVMSIIRELTRRGDSSTVKNQLRNYLRADDDEEKEARYRLVEERLDAALAKPEAEEVFYKPFSAISQKSKFGRKAAENWMKWACQKGLLLRGFEASCEKCLHKQWRPFADAVPELICHGCGSLIEDPYGLNSVVVRYRSSETLLRAMNKDVLSHILTLRYLTDAIAGLANAKANIFGSYPGLNIVDGKTGNVCAEADVVIVLGNGRWLVGECKNTALGLREDDLSKIWDFADRVDAVATFVATLDPSEKCGEIWRRKSSPNGRPHFALTAEHLYQLRPRVVSNDSRKFYEWRSAYSSEDGTEEALRSEFSAFLEGREDDQWAWKRAPWLRNT
ncbi:hypothetical protein [Nocardia salmonicida]